MFSCIEFTLVVLALYEMYSTGLITQEEWAVERTLLGYRTLE